LFPPPPTGFVPHGAASATGGVFSRIKGVAKALVIAQVIGAFLAVAALAAQMALAGPAEQFVAGDIGRGAFEDEMATLQTLTLIGSMVSIAAMVLIIVWSFRIAGNLRKMGRDITWKPGLAIAVWILGGCTLGIINLLLVREHWKASDPAVRPGDQSWKTTPVRPIIWVWFALSAVSAALQARLAFRSGNSAIGGVGLEGSTNTLAESLADDLAFVVAQSALAIASSIALIIVIRLLTQRHVAATLEP
jgi:hypothetical protein